MEIARTRYKGGDIILILGEAQSVQMTIMSLMPNFCWAPFPSGNRLTVKVT